MSSITQGIGSIVQNIASILSYINPLSENFFLLNLWNFLTNIVSYINPLSENFFGYKIIDLLSDLFEYLFIPSQERITAITNTVSSKFAFVDSIKYSINSIKDIINNVGNAPKLTLNLGATKYTQAGNYTIIDLSWYAPYKTYGDLVLTGFIYLFFIWCLFVHLPNIIHGTAGDIKDDVQIFNNFNDGGGSL